MHAQQKSGRVANTALRRALPVGTTFVCEFIGANRHLCRPGLEKTRRRVVSQTPREMVSEFLDGPSPGEVIWLTWAHCVARHEDGAYILSTKQDGDDFLRISV